jgi:16S rRNA (uracil1498-N3)-methyltransferase
LDPAHPYGLSHRFFVDAPVPDEPVVTGEQARQIASVLRLRPGEMITLVHSGKAALVRLDVVSDRGVRGHVVERRAAETESQVALTLALPLLKGDRDEEVVEAVTQLGVARMVPFVSSRSVVRSLSAAKRERWRRIARESAETARRGQIPEIAEAREWDTLFDLLGEGALVAWEEEPMRRLSDALKAPRVAIVIGPEGGLAAEEIESARRHGAITVSLGPRNLRSETAAIAAVAQAMAVLET